jgi:hypothetical protein
MRPKPQRDSPISVTHLFIWSKNVTESGIYKVCIEERGWYTISLTGRWSLTKGTRIIGINIEEDRTLTVLPVHLVAYIHVTTPDEEYAFFAFQHYGALEIPV